MEPMEPIEFRRTYVDRQDPNQVQWSYDRKLDTLFIDLEAPKGPKATYYIEDGVNIVFDPMTNEVVGFHVDDWQLIFLRRHSNLRWSWYRYRLVCWIDVLCKFLSLPSLDRRRFFACVEQVALNAATA
jgi:hypothetical protein